MSRLGFQLFHMSLKRTGATTGRCSGLRYISSEQSIGRGVNCPTPFRLLGPPEVTRSTLIANSLPDDEINNPRMRFMIEYEFPRDYYISDPSSPFCVRFLCDQKPGRKSKVFLRCFLEYNWSHYPETILKLLCLLRNTSYFRRQSRELFYTAAIWLHLYHPETLASNVRVFAKFGSLKDLLEILYRIVSGPRVRRNQIRERKRVRKERQERLMAMRNKSEIMQMEEQKREHQKREQQQREQQREHQREATHLRNEKRIMVGKKAIEKYNYDPKYRFLHDQISNLFVELLKADLEYLISGQLAKISLAAKWCPSLDSSYDRSTLFCESVARKLFPYDSCPEYRELDEAHYAYRVRDRLRKEVLVPLRRALELPEIYMSANRWNLLPYDRITYNAMKTYKRLFYKHDHDRFSQHLQNVQCPEMPKTTPIKLHPHEILCLLKKRDDRGKETKIWNEDYLKLVLRD